MKSKAHFLPPTLLAALMFSSNVSAQYANELAPTPTPVIEPATVRIALPAPVPEPIRETTTHGSRDVYRFRAGLEIPLIGLGTATLLTAFVPTSPPSCLPNCQVPTTMNALDREALGNRSDAAGTVSNVGLFAVMFAPHVINLIATRGHEAYWLEDLFVSVEATLLATGTSQVMKTGMGRFSPRVYDTSLSIERRSHGESTRSFWSSHTATATAAATSFAVSYWLRHPNSAWRWAVLGGLEATAIGVGLMTILAGWHFPTDVIAGAAAGVSFGVAVPMLHTLW